MEKKPVRAAGTVKRNSSARARAYQQRMKKKRQKQYAMLAAAVTVLIIALVLILRGCSGSDDIVETHVTPPPTSTAVPTATPVPTVAPTAQPIQYLPIITNGPTTAKRICITVDDCYQVNNLEKLMDLCVQQGAKITVFPIGMAIEEKKELPAALRRAHNLGFEIENHTYSHTKLYSMTDEEMAADIVKQNMLVNASLGMDYEMHFLRMRGGNGEDDLRSHQYLVQLGNYKAIAHWSYSGSDANLSHIKKQLTPGAVFLFHTTDDDWKKLREFIPYAVSQGYELVTLNEMFGFEPNAVSALKGDPMSYEIPKPYPFVYTKYVTMGSKSKMYAVLLIQRRLQELGWLSTNAVADGEYGATAKAAVAAFQGAAGITVDGFAGVQTQTILFSDNAPVNTGAPIEPVTAVAAE